MNLNGLQPSISFVSDVFNWQAALIGAYGRHSVRRAACKDIDIPPGEILSHCWPEVITYVCKLRARFCRSFWHPAIPTQQNHLRESDTVTISFSANLKKASWLVILEPSPYMFKTGGEPSTQSCFWLCYFPKFPSKTGGSAMWPLSPPSGCQVSGISSLTALFCEIPHNDTVCPKEY